MIIVKAKYLVPNPELCIENGAVAIKDTHIHRVGTFDEIKALPGIGKIIDLGNTIILPGFINLHTHLDLTNLHNRIKPTHNFTHWVFQLIGARMRWKEENYINSIEKGVEYCVEAGTTTVADIAHTEHSFSVLKKSPLRKIVYKEVIDLKPDHAEEIKKKTSTELSLVAADNLFHIGVSPHAPYSVSQELYQALTEIAHSKKVSLCTHVAETQDEIEFLTKGTGNFPSFLRQIRAIPDNWQPPGLTPIHYLNKTGILKAKPVLIHCNYVTDEEISLIHFSGASVAFCPRSHNYFGHTNYPIKKLLNAEVNVGLGTDSLASNDTLSILDEMKFLFSHYAIPQKNILSMATINGARALGMESKVGQIKENFEADLCGIGIQDCQSPDVYHKLMDTASRNIFTMIAGNICYHLS
ncbi:MAG: amidohydrolase family protein [Candidatus Brocadiaceae bacterium]